jgi:hypothetical protein
MPNFSRKQLSEWREERLVKTDLDLPVVDRRSLLSLIKNIDEDIQIEEEHLLDIKDKMSYIKFTLKCLEKRRKKALAALDKINGN